MNLAERRNCLLIMQKRYKGASRKEKRELLKVQGSELVQSSMV